MWRGRLADSAGRVISIVLPLAALLGSSCLLIISLLASPGTAGRITVLLLGSASAIVAVFYLVEATRFLHRGQMSRLYFGLGREIRGLSHEQVSSLISEADHSYSAVKGSMIPSLGSSIRNLFTPKGAALAAVGAIVGYAVPFSTTWSILVGVLIGVISPYGVSVFYAFLCPYMHRYRHRSEYVRAYLDEKRHHQQSARQSSDQPSRVMKKGKTSENRSNSEARNPAVLTPSWVFQHPARPQSGFIPRIEYIWNAFSLVMPVCCGLIVFAVRKLPLVVLGLFVGLAGLPFMGLAIASASVFQPFVYLFGLSGWTAGFQHSVDAIYVFAAWNLPHTVSDFAMLAAVAYVLGVLNVPNQVRKSGVAALPSIIVSLLLAPAIRLIGCLIFPLLWIMSLGRLKYKTHAAVAKEAFAGFWTGAFHLWVMYTLIRVFMHWGETLLYG